jgi:HEAT repeat protein
MAAGWDNRWRPSKEDEPQIVAMAAAAERGDAQYLIEALRDPRLRFYALKLLGDINAQEAIPQMIRLLEAGQRATRSTAADALGRMQAKEAVPHLLERLEVETELAPRSYAAVALGRTGDDRALRPLCALLRDDDLLVRLFAAKALGLLGHPDAIQPLREARAKDWWYRRRYSAAIKAIRQAAPTA